MRLFWVLTLAITPALAQTHLIWQDEFDGAAGTPPDPTKWTYDLGGGGWGNRELEHYTDARVNVEQDGRGHLVIRATKNQSGQFVSARIKTQGRFSFTYGRVEARMKLPRGQGMWPAFWMLGDDIQTVGWPGCGEIDVMENIGREPDTIHGTIHGPGYSGAHGIGAPFVFGKPESPSDSYHVYAVDWRRNRIDFLVDGSVFEMITPERLPAATKWVYNHQFFLLLNLAVGGSWPGAPDSATLFPQELSIDWVRVYSKQ
jgi:beta-glucanase (GH16 family)